MKKQNIIFTAIIAFVAGLSVAWWILKNDTAGTKATQSKSESAVGEEIWTCSMHPQIRQNEPGLCPICEMDLIPLETNSSNDPLVLEMTPNAVALADIQTTIIGRSSRDGVMSIKLSGRIKPDERRVSSQVTHVPGRIEKLFVSFTGDEVKQGQKIAEIYSPELITAQRELIEASRMEGNESLLDAAKNKLRYWKIPEQTIDEILETGLTREVFPVYASESGIVTDRMVSVGDYVNKGSVLLKLVNLQKLWVMFDAYEKDLAYINTGQSIRFTTSSYPDTEFQSRVSFIDPLIDPVTRVATVRTEIDNTGRKLKPEMFVTGILTSKLSKNAEQTLMVPKSAVMWTGKRSVVYIKLQDREIPSFEFREIELGDAAGHHYEVVSGLKNGEEVVTHGNFVIDAAAQLNNQASMMNRDVSIKKEQVMVHDFKDETPDKFKFQLHQLANSYLTIKNAMVNSDPESASDELIKFQKHIQEVDMGLVKEEAHLFWMDKMNALSAHSQMMMEASSIEDQRKQFEFLSNALIETISAFGLDTGKLYVQYCPMAFNNKGAAWLAEEEEIRNPYFGNKMLKCGVVKDIFE